MRKPRHSKRRRVGRRLRAASCSVPVPAASIRLLVVNAMHAAMSSPPCIVLKERSGLLQPQVLDQAALLRRLMGLHSTLPLTEHHALDTILAGFPPILL